MQHHSSVLQTTIFQLLSRDCFFTSSSVHRRDKFMEILNHSFGSGGMTCGVDQNALPYFIQSLKRQCKEQLPTKKAVLRPGKQENGLFYLNEGVCVDEDGRLVQSPGNEYVWLKKELVSENDKMLVSDIIPHINLPLSTSCLRGLISQLEACLKHNFIPSLMVIAGTMMAFHYLQIVATYGGCSLTIASGPPATGKTTAIRAGLALCGCANNNMFVKGTNRGFLERSSMSTLPYGIDDPGHSKGKSRANNLDLTELVVDLYNGAPTTNYSTGVLIPLSLPIVATNFDQDSSTR